MNVRVPYLIRLQGLVELTEELAEQTIRPVTGCRVQHTVQLRYVQSLGAKVLT